MKSSTQLGAALGFLAGTTFGSGIAFLLRFEPVPLMLCVTLCGLTGMLTGLLTVTVRNRRSRLQER
ncbi:hypothetical protein [Paenibacillus sp. FSL R7-0652]|jgi:hypothetical protein|uniref:Uncharacterized protein n=1 Tax=Paenibacillus sp. AN1007 TaxID=3151385 RepID=A0AAU8N5X9_9BACL